MKKYQRKLLKEYSYSIDNKAKVKIGCLDKHKSEVIYINTTCWITPLLKENYKEKMNYLYSYLKSKIKTYIRNKPLFTNNFILDFDNKTKYMKHNKRSFLLFEILLKQNGNEPLGSFIENLKQDANSIINDFLNNIEKEDFQIETIISNRRKKE